MRSMTAAAATMCWLDGGLCLLRNDGGDTASGAGSRTGTGGQRIICVGLGSGAMPAFIAEHFPDTTVEVVEIDPVVVEAVRDHHGLTVPLRNAAMGASEDWAGRDGGDETQPTGLGMVMGDAGAFMSQAAAAVAAGAAPPAAVILLVGRARDGGKEARRANTHKRTNTPHDTKRETPRYEVV